MQETHKAQGVFLKQSAPASLEMTSDWFLLNWKISSCVCHQQETDADGVIQKPQKLVFGFDDCFQH